MEKGKQVMDTPSETGILFRPDGMAITDRVTTGRQCGIYEKDFPELRRLAIPIARFMVEHGLPMGRVVIQTHRVDVYTDEAGTSFTDEDQDEIFQGSVART